MQIPEWALVHEVVVRRYLGASATGPLYAAAETVPCLIEEKRRLVRDDNGREVVSSTTFRCMPDIAEMPVESEVDVFGRTTTILFAARQQADPLPTPDHWEVNLV